MVSRSLPSGEKAAARAVPLILRLPTCCRDFRETSAM